MRDGRPSLEINKVVEIKITSNNNINENIHQEQLNFIGCLLLDNEHGTILSTLSILSHFRLPLR